ncbi:protein still life, isoform SIF type 1, partial [Caerostris extrusa]
MLHPLPSNSSPDREAEIKRRLLRKQNSDESRDANRSRQHRSETGRRRSLERSMCLDLPDPDQSPPSDHFLYDNHCYVTPPNSSNENSDADRPYVSSDEGPGHFAPTHTPSSPTSRLLLEYEMHLRNALARGLDAESYSLHTFEALLSQSMENVVALMREVHAELEAIRQEERHINTLDGMIENVEKNGKCSTLPLPPFSRHPVLTSGGLSAGSSFEINPPASIPQQPSIESTDSRIYLTSSETRNQHIVQEDLAGVIIPIILVIDLISDDDRLSLTTALSEEEDGEARNSPYRARSGSAAASFNCTGAVRRSR